MTIVFIHLGDQPRGPFFHDAIAQARLFNPRSNIFFIFDDGRWNLSEYDHLRFTQSKIFSISLKSIPLSDFHEMYLNSNSPTKSLGHFWKYTTERFFTFYDFMLYKGLTNAVHVETDVMLYYDVSDVFESADNQTELLFPLDADKAVGALVFARNAQSVEIILKEALIGRHLNDMIILDEVFKKNCSSTVAPLTTDPTSSKEGSRRFYNPLLNSNEIFDAAALGQYLDGVDPIHGQTSTIGFLNEGSTLSLSPTSFGWEFHDSLSRPIFISQESTFFINNLHIHSKRCSRFNSFNHNIPSDASVMISGSRFAAACDVVIGTPQDLNWLNEYEKISINFLNIENFLRDDGKGFTAQLFSELHDAHSIFIFLDSFALVAKYLLPFLDGRRSVFTHLGQAVIDNSYAWIFNNPAVEALYAANCTLQDHRAYAVPFGLSYQQTDFASPPEAFRADELDLRSRLISKHNHFACYSTDETSVHFSPSRLEQIANTKFISIDLKGSCDSPLVWETIYTGGEPILAAGASMAIPPAFSFRPSLSNIRVEDWIYHPPGLDERFFMPFWEKRLSK